MTLEFFDAVIAKWTGIVLFILMIPAFRQIWNGPGAIDRIVGVNIIGTKTAVLLVVIGVIFGQVDMFVDFALAYALLNFIGSIAASRFLHRVPSNEGRETAEEEAAQTNS